MNSSGFSVMENIITKEEPVGMYSSDLGDVRTISTERQVEMYSSGLGVTETIDVKGHLVQTEIILKGEERIEINSSDRNMDTSTTEQLLQTNFSDPDDIKECIMKKTKTRDILLCTEEIMNEDSDDDIFSEGDSGENKTELIDITKIKMEDVDIEPYIDVKRNLPLEKTTEEISDSENFCLESSKDCIQNYIKSEEIEIKTDETVESKDDRNEENPKKFQCPYCWYESSCRENLSTHIKDIHGIPFSCHRYYCRYKTYDEDGLKKHQALHLSNAKLKCSKTKKRKKVFHSKTNIDNHSLSTRDNLCDTVISKADSYTNTTLANLCSDKTMGEQLFNHFRFKSVQQMTKYQCNYCSHSFFKQEELKRHISSVHLEITPYICKVCKITFKKKLSFDRHIISRHQTDIHLMKMVTAEIGPYICKSCNKVFKTKHSLDRHIVSYHQTDTHLMKMVTTEIGPYICKGCEKVFKTKYSLDSHIVSCHQTDTDLMKMVTTEFYFCDHCTYKCVRNGVMEKHVKTHKYKQSQLRNRTLLPLVNPDTIWLLSSNNESKPLSDLTSPQNS